MLDYTLLKVMPLILLALLISIAYFVLLPPFCPGRSNPGRFRICYIQVKKPVTIMRKMTKCHWTETSQSQCVCALCSYHLFLLFLCSSLSLLCCSFFLVLKVLIWKSFFDFKEKFLPCSGVFNHAFGDFLTLMRVLLVVCALLSLTCVKPWQFPLAPLCDAGRWICHGVMAKVSEQPTLSRKFMISFLFLVHHQLTCC
jgi:hypothetical protein